MWVERRAFLKGSVLAAAGVGLGGIVLPGIAAEDGPAQGLPEGSAPAPVAVSHFPDRVHAFVWRNWTLVPLARMAVVLGATVEQVVALGRSMGLGEPPRIGEDQWRRSYLTIIRRNWHLLPYAQLLRLLGWTAEQMAFALREDDFLFIKLGSLKPKCAPLEYVAPDDAATKRAREIAGVVRETLANPGEGPAEPLFSFVAELSRPLEGEGAAARAPSRESVRFCYSYFALYGDPLLEPALDPYPDGYLQRLAALGVNGVWLQGVLTKLAPFPWVREDAGERETRLKNLDALVRRAAKYGIGIYLYLNEPRAMPVGFYDAHPLLKGVREGDHAALCTSAPEVQRALTDGVAHVCRAVPGLAGFFTITGSENLTNCWSHGKGMQCPRCGERGAAEVIAEVNRLFFDGIRQAGSEARLIAWDWGWHDEWVAAIVARLPERVSLMSVSEWSIPIERGGVKASVGEYSISTVGPGPRATRHWELARRRGMPVLAKIQAGNTWELSAVPYIPALENVARHAANLRRAGVKDLMLGWTLGGYPSPNVEVACEIAAAEDDRATVEETVTRTLTRVATRRFGARMAPAVVEAWRTCSRAFGEFPFHEGLVYNAPMQFGPSNPLWPEPTNYKATMIGFPYDDLEGWRQVYPAEVFVRQFALMAEGFAKAGGALERAAAEEGAADGARFKEALRWEIDVMTAASLHFRSTSDQARFVMLRRALAAEGDRGRKRELVEQIRGVLRDEIDSAGRLYAIQARDSRIGFEASNQYYYVPQDLLEKVINCRYLLDHWLPTLEGRG